MRFSLGSFLGTDLMCVIQSILVEFIFSGAFVLDIGEHNNSDQNSSNADADAKQGKFCRRIAIVLHAILVLQTTGFASVTSSAAGNKPG